MTLGFILDMYIPIVLVICLCVGFVMKNFLPSDNKWIPLTLMVLGGVSACFTAPFVNIDIIGAGMVTGLAATGLHQVFAQLISGNKNDIDKK